jgi:hypothetical protein
MENRVYIVLQKLLFTLAMGLFSLSNNFCHSCSLQDTVRQSGIKEPVYTASRLVSVRPVIDGKLDDECWKHGTWADDYTQLVPVEGGKPTYQTWLNIQYDNRNLYVAFRSYDGEPEKILRFAGARDETTGDMVGVSFDCYRDYRTGFEFTITAWGQKVDLVHTGADLKWNVEDYNWNAVWNGKVGLEDSAWVAELEIPFSQLRYSRKDEQVWGMHTWRWIARIQEESNWEIQTRTGPGMLYNYGELRGINALKKSLRLEIMPFALADLSTMKKEPANPFTSAGRSLGGNSGLDAKIGISSNYTLNLTVNPDFGQVESDPSVMNLSAFETFYEEKRPFFLEGLAIFDYKFDDHSLFYSRRIGHSPSLAVNPSDTLFVSSPDRTTILSAVKLSGSNSRGLSAGLLQSLTANEFASIADIAGNRSRTKIEPLTNYVVGRITKVYDSGNTVAGAMITTTNRTSKDDNLKFLSREAYTGGIDLTHYWNDKEFSLDARLTGSYIKGSPVAITALQESSARYYNRPGAGYLNYDTTRTNLSGTGGKFRIGKVSKGFLRYSTGTTWLSPGLELNDLGYMTSSDEIRIENVISYFINQPVSIFRSYTVTLEQFNSWNFNGTFLGSGGHLAFNSGFKNQWLFSANLIYHSGARDPRILRGGSNMIMPYNVTFFGSVSTDKTKKIMSTLSYNYEYSGNNSLKMYSLQPGIILRPARTLKVGISADYESNNNNLQYVGVRDYGSEKRYILASIDQKTLAFILRIDLNLNP